MADKSEVSDELLQIYADAGADGIWIYEMGQLDQAGPFMAGAGWLSEVEKIEKREGIEIDLTEISLIMAMHLTVPGHGDTREEACRAAIAALKKEKKKKKKKKKK